MVSLGAYKSLVSYTLARCEWERPTWAGPPEPEQHPGAEPGGVTLRAVPGQRPQQREMPHLAVRVPFILHGRLLTFTVSRRRSAAPSSSRLLLKLSSCSVCCRLFTPIAPNRPVSSEMTGRKCGYNGKGLRNDMLIVYITWSQSLITKIKTTGSRDNVSCHHTHIDMSSICLWTTYSAVGVSDKYVAWRNNSLDECMRK